jgi:hypothetical protein
MHEVLKEVFLQMKSVMIASPVDIIIWFLALFQRSTNDGIKSYKNDINVLNL